MENIDVLIFKCIKNRDILPEPRIGLRFLLKTNNMESYIRLCSRRIAEKDLIDGKNVIFDVEDPYDLMFTADGINICKDILCGYVDKEKIDTYLDYLTQTSEVFQTANAQVQMFRNAPRWLLKGMAKGDNAADLSEETMAVLQQMAKEELKARRAYNILRYKIKELSNRIGMLWRYRRVYLLSIFRPDLFNKV